MGSPLRLAIVGGDEARARAAWETVSSLVEQVELALSRFRPGSDLTRLNGRAGRPDPVPVHRLLGRALAAADRAHRATGGAFEPRVLLDLEALGYPGAPLPGGRPADGAALRVSPGARPAFDDGRWLRTEPRAGRAAVAAPVDLGGIGKGLALRWSLRALETTFPALQEADADVGLLLEAGGDLVAAGRAPQDGPWLVGIEDPRGEAEVAVVRVRNGAVATSSTRVHSWTGPDGRPVHHLVDPRTGEPGGTGLLAVTVAAPDPAWAEVWSKALFLEGASRIAPRARGLGLAAWWIREDGELEMTPAARATTTWQTPG
jgi:thiamine biosynthesis lipoprotein